MDSQDEKSMILDELENMRLQMKHHDQTVLSFAVDELQKAIRDGNGVALQKNLRVFFDPYVFPIVQGFANEFILSWMREHYQPETNA